MPTTVNGIGTHYYGKSDVNTRPGTCRHCGSQGELTSYTTRLWFVILFIPVIPLKRVRLLDMCPRCSRHWVANPEEYEMSRQLAVSGAMDQYRDHPSVEAALEVHAQFLSFHMHSEADQFRTAVVGQFPDKADLLVGLASHLEQVGRWQEATPLFEQAFEINPHLPEARSAKAWRLGESNLDEAYELLDFMRQPGAGQSFNLGQLETLALNYQKAGNHERALELFALLLREFPTAGDRHEFRKVVEKTEKALGRSSSILPDRAFSVSGLFDAKSGRHAPWVRWTVFGAIVTVLFCAGMVGLNEYYRRHRTLHILNGFAQPMTVALDDGREVPVGAHLRLPISEGRHTLKFRGPLEKQAVVELQSSFWSRWTSRPAWVFNLEQISAASKTVIAYAARPQPSTSEWLDDQELSFVPHVDYLFETPPETIQIEGRDRVVTKTHVGQTPVSPSNVMMSLRNRNDLAPGLIQTFAEGYLEKFPADSVLLSLYAADEKGAQGERIAAFLKAGLWRQPISVNWHRAYQNLKSMAGSEDALAAEYEAHLKQSPNDAALLYLRGRVGRDRADQLTYFRQALIADPNLGWAHMALAYDAANRGAWQEARDACQQAASSLGSDPGFRAFWHIVRLANGDADKLETEYNQITEQRDLASILTSLYCFVDAIACQEKYQEVTPSARAWLERILGPRLGPQALESFQPVISYVTANKDELSKLNESTGDERSEYRLQGLLAIGAVDEAMQLADAAKVEEWELLLALAVGLELAGKSEDASRYREQACTVLKSGGHDQIRAAALLMRDQPPTSEELDNVCLRVNDTALWLVAMAQRFPGEREVLRERARRLNVSRMPPYLLVRNALEKP